MSKKTAMIFGCTGQDGSYLSELLLEKDYKVIGVARRVSVDTNQRIKHLFNNNSFKLVEGDITDSGSVISLINTYKPNELYNLAAQSHVGTSYNQPQLTIDVNFKGVANILEGVRLFSPKTKVYQASTSEMWGSNYTRDNGKKFQNEDTPFSPRSPYAVAKMGAHYLCSTYRESYNLHVSCGILHNHESRRRGENFVTRKITKWLGEFYPWYELRVNMFEQGFYREKDDPNQIYLSLIDKQGFPKLRLGNIEAYRDWGHARDYCFNLDVPILTTDGWKFYDDISEGDTVINFDLDNNRLSTDIIKKKFLLDSNGDKIKLRGRGVYLNVTPNHRIYYQKKTKNSKGGWSAWKVCTSEAFYQKLNNKATRSKYDYRLPHFQNYKNPLWEDGVGGLWAGEDWVDANLVYLLGCLLTEGHLSKLKCGRGTVVSLSQSKIVNETIFNKIDKIIKVLKLNCGIRHRNDGVVEWIFNADSSRRILSWFDKFNIHMMPSWCYNLSHELAAILIESMMDCDGHWGGMIYSSKRYLLAVDFQSIACLAGYRTTTLTIRKDGMSSVCLVTKRKKYTYVTEVEKYNDDNKKVWCIETNNSTVITRDHNCISISGNCKAMWLMLQQDKPEDYVIATGETHSVQDFLIEAFKYVNIDDFSDYIVIDSKFFRPTEVDYLCGDATKANKQLGWYPEVTFKELVKDMIEGDRYVQKEMPHR